MSNLIPTFGSQGREYDDKKRRHTPANRISIFFFHFFRETLFR